MVHVGETIPAFTMEDDTGMAVRSEDLRGSWTVLYFYPKDDTPGCTAEACSFRDSLPRFASIGTRVYGVSSDSTDSHAAFREKYGLTFSLLSDPSHTVQEKFGVWKEKSMYGKKYMGTERTTFIVGPDLAVRYVFAKVRPEGHAEEVKEQLDKLTS